MNEAIQKIYAQWESYDKIRDAGVTIPDGLVRHLDIPYGPDPVHRLDVYYPESTTAPLPTIVSVHGGGWFYGSKELYANYCTRMASRGFTVVNFNYRLAPQHKYPAPVEDTCNVLHWIQANAGAYQIDIDNVFMVGDSAGGQIALQVLTMLTNPAYAALFPFSPPAEFQVRACGLNCGCYFIPLNRFLTPKRMGAIFEAYFPADFLPLLPSLQAHKYLTADFPPTFVMTAQNDYLRLMAKPLYRCLQKVRATARLKIYGTRKEKNIGHVFHLNCKLPLAHRCNDDQAAFFRAHMKL